MNKIGIHFGYFNTDWNTGHTGSGTGTVFRSGEKQKG